jgi:hypothetical protein
VQLDDRLVPALGSLPPFEPVEELVLAAGLGVPRHRIEHDEGSDLLQELGRHAVDLGEIDRTAEVLYELALLPDRPGDLRRNRQGLDLREARAIEIDPLRLRRRVLLRTAHGREREQKPEHQPTESSPPNERHCDPQNWSPSP